MERTKAALTLVVAPVDRARQRRHLGWRAGMMLSLPEDRRGGVGVGPRDAPKAVVSHRS
jgi:hypothetical protein